MLSLLRATSPALILAFAAVATAFVAGAKSKLAEAAVHLLLVVAALWITLYLALSDYAADSGANELALIVIAVTIVLGIGAEVAGHFLGRHVSEVDQVRRALRHVSFLSPALLALVIAMISAGARQTASDAKSATLAATPVPELLASTNTVPVVAKAVAERPNELLQTIEAQPPNARARSLLVLAAIADKADRTRAAKLARDGLVSTRAEAVKLATVLKDVATLQAALATANEDERLGIVKALTASGDSTANANEVARAESLLSKSDDEAVRGIRLLGALGDPQHHLDGIVFDHSRSLPVRRAAFAAVPEAKRDSDVKQLVLQLYRGVEIDTARARMKTLGPAARDFLIAEATAGDQTIRRRCIELLSGTDAWETLAKIAADKQENVELRAEALESLAHVDAKRSLPIADAVRKEALNHVSINSAIQNIEEAAKR